MQPSSVGCALPLLLWLVAGGANAQQQQLRLLAEWREAEYEFPSAAERQRTLDTQEYVPGNGVPIDVDIDYGGHGTPRVFVTVPRFIGGIPITLGTLTNQKNSGGPQIRAYPSFDWNANQGNNCDGLTSVFRVAIDACRRLWVLDTGKIGDTHNCQPQLVAFDLDTDRVVLQYKIPAAQYRVGSSLFITPVVDVRDATPGTASTCPNTMVYMADVNGAGLLVYDMLRNRSWRVQNKYLYPSPHAGTFTLAGESFDLMDGVFGLALTPLASAAGATGGQRQAPKRPEEFSQQQRQQRYVYRQSSQFPTASISTTATSSASQSPFVSVGERKLYMHSLASTTEIAVPLRVLDNATMWEANVEASPRSFVEIGNRGAQATAEAMDSNGNLFFGLINPIGLGCWDSTRSYGRETVRVVAQNDDTLQFPSGLKVKRNRDGKEELWVSTCRFQKVMTGSISRDEVNFRIQAVEVEQLLGGQTRCAGNALPSGGVTFPRY